MTVRPCVGDGVHRNPPEKKRLSYESDYRDASEYPHAFRRKWEPLALREWVERKLA